MSEEPRPSEDVPSRFRASPVDERPGGRPVAVVADGDPSFAEACMAWLGTRGFVTHFAPDGSHALLLIQRLVPALAVIDAAVPGMYGFEICEFLKRDPALRSVHTVLVGTVHRAGRYRRPARDVYGADAFVERTAAPEALLPILEQLGHAARPTGPPPVATPQPVAQPAVATEEERARRLARVIVSDLVMYHRSVFDTANTPEDVVAAVGEDLENGRKALAQRIGASAGRDFLLEELLAAVERRIHARAAGEEAR